MSNERPELRKIDAKIGQMIGQFYDHVAEMRRLYEAEMNATDLLQKIIQIRDTADAKVDKATESDWVHILDKALDDIVDLCKEQLKS